MCGEDKQCLYKKKEKQRLLEQRMSNKGSERKKRGKKRVSHSIGKHLLSNTKETQ